MDSKTAFLAGSAMGAGLMFLLDPARGRRRRALARDKMLHAGHEAHDLGDRLRAQSRNLRNQIRGAIHERTRRIRERGVDDHILVERVRSRLGHEMHSPSAVTVTAEQGIVTLSGDVAPADEHVAIRTADHTPGVRDVISRLEAVDASETTPDFSPSNIH